MPGTVAGLFQALSEHLPRQEENYLTQCLLAAFNSSAHFRFEMLKLLGLLNSTSLRGACCPEDVADIQMVGQVAMGSSGHSIFDAVVEDSKHRWLAAIETKFASQPTEKQLEDHLRHLKERRNRCPLFLLARWPDLGEFSPRIRAGVTAVSWQKVVRALGEATRGLRAGGYEREMLEDLMSFLSSKGVVNPRPLTGTDWGRVSRLGAMIAGAKKAPWKIQDQLQRTLDAVSTVIARVELHRDEAWSAAERAGGTPFSGIFRLGASSEAEKTVSIGIGYHKKPTLKKNKSISYYSEISLYLDIYPKVVLAAYSFQARKRAHPRSRQKPWNNLCRFWYSAAQVKTMFGLQWDIAHKKMAESLGAAYRSFSQSAVCKEAE